MTQFREADTQKHLTDMKIGDRFITKSRVITRTDLELYAISTGDTHPMFLSEEYAKASGWKTQIVPGLLAYSIAVGLMVQSGFIADVVAYMGTDNMKFLAPVYPYDTIRVETEVIAKKQTRTGDRVGSYKWVIRNQNNEATAEGENT